VKIGSGPSNLDANVVERLFDWPGCFHRFQQPARQIAASNRTYAAAHPTDVSQTSAPCAHGGEYAPPTAPFASGFRNVRSVRETIQRKNRKSQNANAKNVAMFFSGVANGFQRMSARVMISNERPSPFRTRPTMQSGNHLPFRPHIQEDTLKSEQVQVERKSFVFLLKENPRGRFLRIIEESGRVSNSIIIPCAGLREFQKLLAEMAEAADKLPSKNLP
jgi:hypothetical protein